MELMIKSRFQKTRIGNIAVDWSISRIGNHCNVKSGGTPNSKIDEYYNPPEVPWLKSGDVNLKKITSATTYISKLGLKNSSAKLLPRNSIILGLSGQGKTRGMVSLLEIESSCNQNLACIIPNDNLYYKFLFYFLEYKYEYIRNFTGDKARNILNLSLVKSLPIVIPEIEEQKKISSILENMDNLIQTTQYIIKYLQEIKKGLMHHLFTQGIEHTEFKETELGQIPKNWTVLRMIDCVSGLISGDWGKTEISTGLCKIRVIRGTDFPQVFYSNFSNVPIRYVDKEKIERTNLTKEDLLIELSGGSKDQPTGRILSLNNEIIDKVNKKLYFTNFVKLLRVKDNILSKYFYYYWSYLYNRNRTISYQIQTNNIRNFRYKEFLKFEKIPIPNHKGQRNIVNIIENLDESINNETKYLNQQKIIKKGLMQNLLTGTKRVLEFKKQE